MSSMESFYGGRQGASFVIVKRFDGIDIPETSADAFAKKYAAINEQDVYLTLDGENLIYRDADNQDDYSWKVVELKGQEVSAKQVSTGDMSTITLPNLKLEGMVQCFKKGGETTSEVGYGEYVIIDTMLNLADDTNNDNGKVFRRGMNYDSPLGGAEYIGQIVGPKGDTPTLEMGTIEEIQPEPHQIREYTVDNGSLVPGDENDDITYAWSDVYVNIDEEGNFKKYVGAMIGFKFPYLVPEFTTDKRSAYYQEGDEIPADKEVGDILDDNFDLLVDNGEDTPDREPDHGDTGHPFYRKWKMSIPKGVKGDSVSQFELIPRKIREGSDLWESPDITQEPVDVADGNTTVNFTDDPWIAAPVIEVTKDENTYYAKLEDAWKFVVRYRYTTFDNKETGEYDFEDLYELDIIQQMKIDEDGHLLARYSSIEQWIDLGPVKGAKGDKGDPGGVSIATEFALNEGELPSDYLHPGEDCGDLMGDDAYRGWCVIVIPWTEDPPAARPQQLWAYDYKVNDWFIVTAAGGGGGGGGVADPTQVVILDRAKVENERVIPVNPNYAELPNMDGLWFVVADNRMITAY